MLSTNCAICFKSGNLFTLTEKIVKNDISETLKLKLNYVVPEVVCGISIFLFIQLKNDQLLQDWLDTYHICENCVKDLIIACEFKERCLNIKLQQWKIEGTEYINCSRDFKLECDSDHDSYVTNEHNIDNETEIKIDQCEQSFICYCCNEHYKQKDDLIKHLESNHQKPNNPKYKRKEICSTCGRKYVSPLSLKEHILVCDGIRRHYKSKAEFQCDKCGKYYTTQKILNAHKLKCDEDNFKKSEFQCTRCNKFYQSKRALEHHEIEGCRKNEQVTNTMHCKICNQRVNTVLELDEHLLSIHNSIVLNCDKCKLPFENKTDLQHHKKSCHPSKKNKPTTKFSCEICKKEFTLLKDIKNHCINVHSMNEKAVKPFECEICNTRLRTSTNLFNHKLYHKRTRMNICSFCGKSFITKNDLTSHEIIHYGTRKYKCDKCEKAFKTNTNLRTHQLIVHTDPLLWKHICDICGKRFPQKSSFDQHRRRHLGEKRFSCQLCEKTFTSKGELQGHMKGHLNVQAYKCEHCGKAYRKRYTYNVHMTKIHGIGNAKIKIPEKKHMCHICPGKFTDKIKLARHLCTHTGVKPFTCLVCDKKFIDKSYLKHHMKTIHNIEQK